MTNKWQRFLIVNHDKIEATEIGSDGVWIYLKPGFCLNGEPDIAVHEDTVKQAMESFKGVRAVGVKDFKSPYIMLK